MFISFSQIRASLNALNEVHPFFGTVFLAFKLANLPMEKPIELNFTAAVEDVLQRFYKPLTWHEGFYSPFHTSNRKNRWQNRRYGSTTLQRIAVDTFSKAFIHPKTTQYWAWEENYIEELKTHLNGRKIPVFHLAAWLFRNEVWGEGTSCEQVIGEFLYNFGLNPLEGELLFDFSADGIPEDWLQDTPVTEAELLELIGYPQDAPPTRGAILQKMEMIEVGSARHFVYEPSERLNIITGDNSLGKTFIFDTLWWALTGEWTQSPTQPRESSGSRARIKFSIQNSTSPQSRVQNMEARYEPKMQDWQLKEKKQIEAGLVIYSRYDGSFAIFDSITRGAEKTSEQNGVKSSFLKLSREHVWDGLDNPDGRGQLCNGLIQDWASWQLSESRYKHEWEALSTCLKHLMPPGEVIAPGYPERKNLFDDREIPTLIFRYGPVPLTLASAGIQRILSLAYMLVWAWFRHRRNAAIVGEEPQRRLVLIVDEIEAHLHPKWQRTIVPALLAAIETLSQSLAPQIHLATHSPMVMASVEEVFDENRDDLHHLRLQDREVILEELLFVKRGRADAWLTSDVFGLESPRNIKAENAIKRATDLQLGEVVDPQVVSEVNDLLVETLAPDDVFWPRWRFFALKNGLEDGNGD